MDGRVMPAADTMNCLLLLAIRPLAAATPFFLLLEDNTSFVLLEDNTSFVQLENTAHG
jgi:hypothetical protein